MTLNSLIKQIEEEFAEPHLQIKWFDQGFYEDMAVYMTSNELWPIMYVTLTDVQHLYNSVSAFNVRVYYLDLLTNSDINERDVLSDQLSVARDFTNWLRLANNDLFLLNEPIATPIKSVGMDYTAGWYLDARLEVSIENTACAIPTL
jgi:hypothetical protein